MGCGIMTEIKVDNIVDLAGTGKPNFPVSPTVGSNAALSTLNTYSYTSSATEPSSPKNGALWWDSANNKVFVYIAGEFKEIELGSPFLISSQNYGDKAARSGWGTQQINQLHTFNITTLGNATDWKDLTRTSITRGSAASNSIYGFVFGGNTAGGNTDAGVNNIDYYAFANNTNASDFGDLTAASFDGAACSSTTRACISLAWNTGVGNQNGIDYITMTTPGNASDFGNLSYNSKTICNQSVSNLTRGLFAGGYNTTYANGSNIIEYITIANTGNSTDFGDLTAAGYAISGCGSGSGDRGIFSGGYPSGRYKTIDYVTISNTGNATDFGDFFTSLSNSRSYYHGSVNNATRAVFSCSNTNNNMEYITMATTGNAADFGDQATTTDNRFQAMASGNP